MAAPALTCIVLPANAPGAMAPSFLSSTQLLSPTRLLGGRLVGALPGVVGPASTPASTALLLSPSLLLSPTRLLGAPRIVGVLAGVCNSIEEDFS